MTAGNGAIKQLWYRHGTPNTNDYEFYARTYSSTWSDWEKYVTETEVGTWKDISSNVSVGSNYTVIEKRIYVYIFLFIL